MTYKVSVWYIVRAVRKYIENDLKFISTSTFKMYLQQHFSKSTYAKINA